MRVGLLVIAACGTQAKPTKRVPLPQVPIDAAVVAVDAPSAMTRKGTPHPATEAPHGGAIASLAVNAEGTAAVTTDELGGARLWPAFDGKVEPRILELPHARAISLAARGDRFAVATIDDVGNLAIDLVDANGSMLQRVQPPGELTYLDVLETARGPLAARVDEQVVQLDDNGATLGAIEVESGQKLVELGAAGAHAYALIEKDGGELALRWIEAGPAWGAWIDAGVPIGPLVTISPSGKRLAVVEHDNKNQTRLIAIELATKGRIYDESETSAARPLFADDDHLSLQTRTSMRWADLSNLHPILEPSTIVSAEPAPKSIHVVPAMTGGGRVIAPRVGELVIATPKQTAYLGYELQAPTIATRAPNGQLMIGGEDRFSLLDGQLREVGQLELAQPRRAVAGVRYLAGNDWLVHTAGSDGTDLLVVDAVAHTTQTVRSKMDVVHQLQFEPHTGLIALSLGEQPELLRYDAAKHKVTPVSVLPRGKNASQRMVFPVNSPKAQAVIVDFWNDLTLRWVKDAAHPDAATPTKIGGSFAGIDTTGRAFVWVGQGMSIYDDGQVVATSKLKPELGLFASPGGEMFVQLRQHAISLSLADGTERWQRALEGANEVVWLDDGAFVLVGGAGLARIDAMTGKIQAARCGWRFGLTPRPHVEIQRSEPLCAQLYGRDQ